MANPIGTKCGPSLDIEETIKIIKKINPLNESGNNYLLLQNRL